MASSFFFLVSRGEDVAGGLEGVLGDEVLLEIGKCVGRVVAPVWTMSWVKRKDGES